MNPILVQSHVARDFLQGSAYFNSVPKVVWEYVSNSLDNPRGNQPVHCRVHIGSNRIVIQDDARGMSREDLARFFTMHAENADRAAGRMVRGRFGTGKSAAFGLGTLLRVTSTKDGQRNALELRRDDVVAASDGQPFKVCDLIVDERTEEPSGTTIEVEGVTTKAADVMATKQYVERRLGRYRGAHSVVVNNHVAEFEEPPFVDERTFTCPEGPLAAGSDAIILTIRVSPTPLDESTNGVDILSRGIYHETTLAGRDRAEMHEYLFGFVDIPALEDDAGSIPAFDNTRSGRLNPANSLVAEAYSWVGICLEQVRMSLVERERERKRSAEAQRLSREGEEIAKLLNQDFDEWREEFKRATGRLGLDLGHVVGVGQEDGEILPGDGTRTSPFVMTGPKPGDGNRGDGPGRDGTEERPGGGLASGEGTGSPAGGDGQRPRRRAGGFAIEYEGATPSEARSRYDEERRTIFINLDHPQIAAAKREGIDSRGFRQLSYEVAFSEYSLALPMEMARAQGAIFDAQDAIVEARLTLDRISRLGVAIYNTAAHPADS
jgi:hypothetical protein